jgi:hypothetical protein
MAALLPLTRKKSDTKFNQSLILGEQTCASLALASCMLHNIYKLQLPSEESKQIYYRNNCNKFLDWDGFYTIYDTLTRDYCSDIGYFKILIYTYLFVASRISVSFFGELRSLPLENAVSYSNLFTQLYNQIEYIHKRIPEYNWDTRNKSTKKKLFSSIQQRDLITIHETIFPDMPFHKPPAFMFQCFIPTKSESELSMDYIERLHHLIIHSLNTNNYVLGRIEFNYDEEQLKVLEKDPTTLSKEEKQFIRRGPTHAMVFTRYDKTSNFLYGKDGTKYSTSRDHISDHPIDETCNDIDSYKIYIDSIVDKQTPRPDEVATYPSVIEPWQGWYSIIFYVKINTSLNLNGSNNDMSISIDDDNYAIKFDYISKLLSNPTKEFIPFSTFLRTRPFGPIPIGPYPIPDMESEDDSFDPTVILPKELEERHSFLPEKTKPFSFGGKNKKIKTKKRIRRN